MLLLFTHAPSCTHACVITVFGDRRTKDVRKKLQDAEREKISQQREIERLERELHRVNAVIKHLPASLRLSINPSNNLNPADVSSTRFVRFTFCSVFIALHCV